MPSLQPRRGALKIIGFAVIFLAVCMMLAACHGFPTRQRKIASAAPWMGPLDSTWVLQSPGKPYSIQSTSDLRRNQDDSLRFELRGGERWIDQTFISTYRSEISTKDFPPADSVRWYAFSVYFPTNFPIEDNRLVFAQWHSPWHLLQPGRIPPLAFRFVNGKLSITLRHSADKTIRDPDAVPSEDLFKKGRFPTGRWHDFVVQAKWSCHDDGLVNIWWNNQQITEYKGAVGYDDATGPEFKFGLYRDATEQTYTVYFSEVKSDESAKALGFDPAAATKYPRD